MAERVTEEPVAARYLRLGLQLGRHDDGVVDAYFGPPELAAQVEAEAPVAPARLVTDAEALLAELGEGWLGDQVTALRAFAGVIAGETWSYADEVQACYGVRPVFTGEDVFAAAHEQLEGLLPGPGPLGERYQRWRDSMLVPAERMERTFAAAIEEARSQTKRLVELPAGERVVLETVSDVPWLGYNFYQGELCGRVAINASVSKSAVELLDLALHETYPGHQAERASKEHLLVRERGMAEETLVLAFTPQSVISEGIARLAPQILLEGDGQAAFADIARGAGVEVDLDHALAIEAAIGPCEWAQVNAALMLHEGDASPDEAREYLQRWALLAPDLAGHVVRFITEPSSRTYVIAYPAGLQLCRDFVAGDAGRFRRLLTEQLRVSDLR
ncbi:MAG TPA: hypothetical protein VJT16_13125 [Streptosporangiaceae bacterium]|nr:hypothetical protein [Streptosporangiaceae bacterium]